MCCHFHKINGMVPWSHWEIHYQATFVYIFTREVDNETHGVFIGIQYKNGSHHHIQTFLLLLLSTKTKILYV